jgi:hypothetical protein
MRACPLARAPAKPLHPTPPTRCPSLDLLERGYEVHVLTDGVSSQRLTDRGAGARRWGGLRVPAAVVHAPAARPRSARLPAASALETALPYPTGPAPPTRPSEAGLMRMSQSGAFLVSSEMCLFQLMKVGG